MGIQFVFDAIIMLTTQVSSNSMYAGGTESLCMNFIADRVLWCGLDIFLEEALQEFRGNLYIFCLGDLIPAIVW